MSFEKARDLIDLVTWLTANRNGVTIQDVEQRFNVVRRTAQRMLQTAEQMFLDIETFNTEAGLKAWYLRHNPATHLIRVSPEEISTLELARKILEKQGSNQEAKHLNSLSNKVLALMPSNKAVSVDTDSSALLEAQGIIARPGPRPIINEHTLSVIGEAVKGCLIIEFIYEGTKGPEKRTLAPYGILYGTRQYLVAHHADSDISQLRYFRLDRIKDPTLTERYFERDQTFDINEFAKTSFAVFQNNIEYEEVVWKFSPTAAESAASYSFHPDQILEPQEDGSLIVRFHASGHLEMCWFLYSWGKHVEVIKPEALRQMCKNHKNVDFLGLP